MFKNSECVWQGQVWPRNSNHQKKANRNLWVEKYNNWRIQQRVSKADKHVEKESATWRTGTWKLASDGVKRKKEWRNLWEVWDAVKRNNICIMVIPEEKKE